MNWSNKAEVIAHAKKLGPGMTVIKRPELDNFNIIHTVNEPRLLRDATVVHRT